MKTDFDYHSIDDAIDDPDFISSKIVFITGPSALGKTTLAKALEKKGFSHIEFDTIAKSKVNPVFKLTQDESININRGKAPVEIEDYFVNKVHEAAREVLNHGKLVIEGTMSNERVLRKIFSGILSDYTFIYLYPIYKDKYKQRVMKRFSEDVIRGTQTLPIWDFIDSKIVETYKQSGFKHRIVIDYIDELINKLLNNGHSRYQLFVDMGFDIVTISV